MIDNLNFHEHAVFQKLIQKRTFSQVSLFDYAGTLYVVKEMYPNGPNGEVSQELLMNSLTNYFRLASTKGLVKILGGWWDEGKGCMITVMEYLDGYLRAVDVGIADSTREAIFHMALEAMANMMIQGYTDYDFDPTNIMFNPITLDVKLIDLDKIMRLDEACKDRSHYGSWLCSRFVRLFRWSADFFNPQQQFTKVEKLNVEQKQRIN